MSNSLDSFMDKVINKNPEQIEFHQAVKEVMESIWSFLDDRKNIQNKFKNFSVSFTS